MTNIVERLRAQARYRDSHRVTQAIVSNLEDEAADEIERLRAENAEMRRTFGSHPLFAEKDAEIARLKTKLAKTT